jgi:hypothetical protein
MKKHILLDIEALGLRPGSAIIEIGAVEFIPETGFLGEQFEMLINPTPPFTADLATLEWHRQKETWPRPFGEDGEAISTALAMFNHWLSELGEIEAFWAWGATYDFPLLTAAYDFAGCQPPWKYYQQRCARTIWQTAFGVDRKHEPRPHRAIEDAVAGATDLIAALQALTGKVAA